VAEPVSHPPVPGKLVLVADDEADIAEVIARLLREDGDEVSVAHGGAEALKLLETRAFDLVISDMEMEQVKGPTSSSGWPREGEARARRFSS